MTVVWAPSARKDLRRLDRTTLERVYAAVHRLAETGHGDAKKLQGVDEYRLRVGKWRVRFQRHDETATLKILRVLPRGEAYR